MKTQKIILVVGCGSIGQRHARLLVESPATTLWACDLNKEFLAQIADCAELDKTFTDYKTALKEKPDMVWICTPDAFHAPVAIDSMAAGVDVFCEKPLAENIASGQAVVKAVERTGRTFSVGYPIRCMQGFCLIKKMIDEKRIGSVVSAQACVGAYDTLLNCKTDYLLTQQSALILNYSHEIDYLRWFLGHVNEVFALSACVGQLEKKPDPNIISAALRFESGALASLHMDYLQYPGRRSIELFGDKGRISYWFRDDHLKVYTFEKQEPEKIPITDNRDDSFRREHDLFFEAVKGQSQVMVSAQDALETMKVCKAIVDSYQSSSLVRL